MSDVESDADEVEVVRVAVDSRTLAKIRRVQEGFERAGVNSREAEPIAAAYVLRSVSRDFFNRGGGL